MLFKPGKDQGENGEGVMENTIRLAEREVWEALKTGDATSDTGVLRADVLGIYPAGYMVRHGAYWAGYRRLGRPDEVVSAGSIRPIETSDVINVFSQDTSPGAQVGNDLSS